MALKLFGRGREAAELELAAEAFLEETPPPEIPRALRDYGLSRVMALASSREESRGGKEPVHRRPAFARRLALILLVCVLVLAGGTSVTYAASLDAMPGSTLYGSKIFFERALLFFTISRTEDARLEMSYCERRVQELERLLRGGEEQGRERWLQEYLRNLDGAESLLDSVPPQEAEALSSHFLEMLEGHSILMHDMRRDATSALSPILERAYEECGACMTRMRKRYGQGGGDLESPGMPGGCNENGGAGGDGRVSPGNGGPSGSPEQEELIPHADGSSAAPPDEHRQAEDPYRQGCKDACDKGSFSWNLRED